MAWSGYKQRSKVAEWLRTNGVQFLVGRDGWPRVQTTQTSPVYKTLTRSSPNVAGLKEMQRNGQTKKVPARST